MAPTPCKFGLMRDAKTGTEITERIKIRYGSN